jgi:hypothetical protein
MVGNSIKVAPRNRFSFLRIRIVDIRNCVYCWIWIRRDSNQDPAESCEVQFLRSAVAFPQLPPSAIDCGSADAVVEQHFFKKCGYAVVEVLPSSYRIVIVAIKKLRVPTLEVFVPWELCDWFLYKEWSARFSASVFLFMNRPHKSEFSFKFSKIVRKEHESAVSERTLMKLRQLTFKSAVVSQTALTSYQLCRR